MILHSKIVGKGTPFLILHGFLGMGDNWRTLALRFVNLGYQLHLIDQRNHGRSFHNPIFNYDVMALDLEAYCKFYKLDKCILLGHSMGGKTSMRFSALYPYRVQKLIVVDIAPRFYPIHHQHILDGLSSLDFSVIKTRKQADVKLSEFLSDLVLRQFLLKNLYWQSKERLAFRFNLKHLKTNIGEVGKPLSADCKVLAPSLFLRGSRSDYILSNDQEQISNQFTNSSLFTISNAGHWLHAENPNAFFEAVANFLS
ncbi:MAG: alpha/beta hydrolase [Flavobacteriaceae bacterium]|nr:alpha/beta hydrolase [Flavobacteriaceae bacterium]|tara:strand:+ start:10238 stop:11002 length:765 start_codon:yes stop_codon:yes gene_type:complete